MGGQQAPSDLSHRAARLQRRHMNAPATPVYRPAKDCGHPDGVGAILGKGKDPFVSEEERYLLRRRGKTPRPVPRSPVAGRRSPVARLLLRWWEQVAVLAHDAGRMQVFEGDQECGS